MLSLHSKVKKKKNDELQMNRDVHQLRPWPFWLWVVTPQNHGEPIRDKTIPGLQKNRNQTDQA